MTAVLAAPPQGSVIPAGYLQTTRAMDARSGAERPHAHGEDMLLWVHRGSARVATPRGERSLGPGQGWWVPAGTVHRASTGPGTVAAATYFAVGAFPDLTGPERQLEVPVSVREMLIHQAGIPMDREMRLSAQRLCAHLILEADSALPHAVMPTDPRIAALAQAVADDLADDRGIEEWSADFALSSRTVARAFQAELGIAFSAWRTALRMSAAAALLRRGVPVSVIAHRVGYATTSAFSAAFRRHSGETPTGYAARRR